jgi:D-ala-D-ala dipeptidase
MTMPGDKAAAGDGIVLMGIRAWPPFQSPTTARISPTSATTVFACHRSGPMRLVISRAIDLTLCAADGTEFDLGTPVNATPEQSAGACYTDHPSVGGEARRNRATLAEALHGAGLVNYPTEWWHWSYGDRYWAMATGVPRAIYGAANRR